MKNILLALGLLIMITNSVFSQSKLTTKQIRNRNYQEVIGPKSQSTDTVIPDQYPMYPNGMKGMLKHISKHLIYPPNAYKKGIQGIVILKFLIEKDGRIKEIEVVKSVNPDLDAEAIRVLKKLKIRIPGYKDGKPINFEYKFPFNFKSTFAQ